MRHAEPEIVEGEWREWGRGGEPVNWPFTPAGEPRERPGHELTGEETARALRTVRRRPFHRLALVLLGVTPPAQRTPR